MAERGGKQKDITQIFITDFGAVPNDQVVLEARKAREVLEDELREGSVAAVRKGEGPIRIVGKKHVRKFLRRGYEEFDPFAGVE